MNKENYLAELKNTLKNKKRRSRYISACLSYAERLIDNGLPVIFDTRHLALLIGIKTQDLSALLFSPSNKVYKTILIPKKSGGKRELLIPCLTLKYIQRWILDNVLNKIPVSDYTMGFVEGRSIVTNASSHIGSFCIINLDIVDFFPSISFDRVFYIFKYYGYTKEISYVLAKICTCNGKLPQGSPASPYISNISCLKLDKRIYSLAQKYGAIYTRYADDITISGNKTISNIIGILTDIINSEGFAVNNKKTRILYPHQRQEITGLIVNNGSLKIPKAYKRKIQQEIYYCKKYGVNNHKIKTGDEHRFYKEHLYGKAYYVFMVEPKIGKNLLKQLNEMDWEK